MKIEVPKGTVFGRLKTIKEVESHNGRRFKVKCECGTIKAILLSELRRRHSLSCGCLNKENSRKAREEKSEKSGLHHPLNPTWRQMIARCTNKLDHSYINYGARGIYVVKRWLGNKGFWNFVKWAEENGWYEDCGLEIDREDNNGPYSPSNCRWITHKENSSNKRNTKYVEYKGETIAYSEAVDKYGIKGLNLEAFRSRLKLGWDVETALKTKVKYRRPNYSAN